MKVGFASDMHLEFGIPHPSLEAVAEVDVLVLAGDIDKGFGGSGKIPRTVEYAHHCAEELDRPVVIVLGNHEFYDEEYHAILNACRTSAAHNDRVHFLENDSVLIDDVRFIGCTLWSDFKLGNEEAFSRRAAYEHINDYHIIDFVEDSGKRRSLIPHDTAGFNAVSRAYLEEELATPFDDPIVVVSHFPPVFLSDPKFQDSPVSAYFCNDWRAEIEDGKLSPDLWITGHTHYSADIRVGRTRIVSRQGGYPGELAPFEWGIVDL